jgi:hypothetical protein
MRREKSVISRAKAERYKDYTYCQADTVNLLSEDISDGVQAFVNNGRLLKLDMQALMPVLCIESTTEIEY